MRSNKWLVVWSETLHRPLQPARATIVDFGPDPAKGPYGNEAEVREQLVQSYNLQHCPHVHAMVSWEEERGVDEVVINDQEAELREITVHCP